MIELPSRERLAVILRRAILRTQSVITVAGPSNPAEPGWGDSPDALTLRGPAVEIFGLPKESEPIEGVAAAY